MYCIVKKVSSGVTNREYVWESNATVGNVFLGRFGGHTCMVEVVEVL